MKVHEDDVLEWALNNGVLSAANKYNLSTRDVKEIVMRFKRDIDDDPSQYPCDCEKARQSGVFLLCMFCTRDYVVQRIRI